MLLASIVGGLMDGLVWVYAGFVYFVLAAGAIAWTFNHLDRMPVKAPAWRNDVILWTWVAWAFLLGGAVLPSSNVFLNMMRGGGPEDWQWAWQCGTWLVGALGIPAGILLGATWLARWQARRRRREQRALPWWTF